MSSTSSSHPFGNAIGPSLCIQSLNRAISGALRVKLRAMDGEPSFVESGELSIAETRWNQPAGMKSASPGERFTTVVSTSPLREGRQVPSPRHSASFGSNRAFKAAPSCAVLLGDENVEEGSISLGAFDRVSPMHVWAWRAWGCHAGYGACARSEGTVGADRRTFRRSKNLKVSRHMHGTSMNLVRYLFPARSNVVQIVEEIEVGRRNHA